MDLRKLCVSVNIAGCENGVEFVWQGIPFFTPLDCNTHRIKMFCLWSPGLVHHLQNIQVCIENFKFGFSDVQLAITTSSVLTICILWLKFNIHSYMQLKICGNENFCEVPGLSIVFGWQKVALVFNMGDKWWFCCK